MTRPIGLSLVAGSTVCEAPAVGSVRRWAPPRFLGPALLSLLSLVVAQSALGQNTFSVNDVSILEGAAGTTTLTFTVSRSNAGGNPSVQVATVNGTATTTDNDYVAVTTTTLNFTPAVVSLPVQVTINGDAKVESDETFTVVLFNPAPASWTIAKATGVGTITNDDSATVVIGAAAAVPEGPASTTASALFPVDLSAQVDVNVTVNFATEDLQATAADNDYLSATGTVTFLAGTTTTQTIAVTVNGDDKVEFDQGFQVRISNVSAQGRSVTIPGPTSVAPATIQNDDQGRIVVNDVTQAEGSGGPPTSFTFNVALLDQVEIPPGGTLSVDVGTTDGTATVADSDYVTNSGTRSFLGAQGEIQTFVVPVTRDAKVELSEAFQANLSNLLLPAPPGVGIPPLDVVISDGVAVGAITNDDSATLSITDTAAFETDTGTTPTLSFTATLSAQVDVPVSVSFATANVTASTADGDYVAASGTLNFPANAGQPQTVSVTVNGDDKVELDESFLVNLSNIQASGRNVTFADSAGGGTIVNDETATLSINDVTQAEGGPGVSTTYNFTVTLDSALAHPISVDVDAADDTATSADNDFTTASPPTLNFTGVQNQSIGVSVGVNGDSFAELDEAFHVVLSNLQAGGLAVDITDQGLGTITNDDVMDLAITKDDGGVNSFPGGPVSYTLDYDNLGASTARGVVITETVPDNTTFSPPGSTPGWVCVPDDGAGSTCTLNVGSVAAGGSGSAIFAVTVDDVASLPSPPPLNITNTASISDETGGLAETATANNSDTDTTPLESAPADFFTLDPCRVIDTRNAAGPLGGPALDAGSDRVFPVAGTCGIPPTATAISVNIAVTAASADGNVRIHPGGTPVPLISSINYVAGQTRSNNAIVVLNANGELAVSAVQASGTVHFILDVNGYFE